MPRSSSLFQSTLSVRRATRANLDVKSGMLFQSTLSVRRATIVGVVAVVPLQISIHALRKESDPLRQPTSIRPRLFQSTLSVRRATATRAQAEEALQFQSTLSVRRATAIGVYHLGVITISIHALRKESDQKEYFDRLDGIISIHALRKESDGYVQEVAEHVDISIHALRKESDLRRTDAIARANISIHALRKESDCSGRFGQSRPIFQSTLSVRRATPSDFTIQSFQTYFNPRSP